MKLEPALDTASAAPEIEHQAKLAVEINAGHASAYGKAREAIEHARRADELLLQAKTAARFNKWFAMWRYNHGYLSQAGIESAFLAHPEWINQ